MSVMMRLIAIAAAMSAFLIVIIGDHQVRRMSGTEVILDLEPVDPRDLLAGYYVIISTPVHRIRYEAVGGDTDFALHDDVFVAVAANPNGSWAPVSIHRERPVAGVFLRGKVQSVGGDALNADFNIERYYANEATAQALEARRREDRDSLRLIVSVGADGRALIRGLEIDGEREIAPLL
ncbi:GDYXXLXY domain-containing protein [Hyphobacterium sp.]|uniref:GDYXXLXY domain-containing protein n=1 Tax=Hyphobacterium sp. TaxID=2004662 RepID=UPI003B51DD19